MPTHSVLSYKDQKNGVRLLVNMPEQMHRDLRVVAGAHDCSVSELIRRSIGLHLAALLRAHPEWAKSFQGQVVEEEALVPMIVARPKKNPVARVKLRATGNGGVA